MINAGLGPARVNSFLTGLEIPPISYNALSKREKEVEEAFKNVADESCQRVLLREIELTREEAEQ